MSEEFKTSPTWTRYGLEVRAHALAHWHGRNACRLTCSPFSRDRFGRNHYDIAVELLEAVRFNVSLVSELCLKYAVVFTCAGL